VCSVRSSLIILLLIWRLIVSNPRPLTRDDFTCGVFSITFFDAKYGVTRGLITDFTYNTDFAQIEEDEQQVNLTRFNLLFPEKRDFFLEGAGDF